MVRLKALTILVILSGGCFSQNDLDAIRYSRTGTGGSSRFVAMGGAFGALGADLTCSAYNPGGLGLYRKGEISFAGGLMRTDNKATLYKTTSSVSDLRFVFNNFGISVTWIPDKDPESRNVLAFTNTQTRNFFNSTRLTGYTNSSSIAKDMLNLANQYSSPTSLTGNLNYSYEGLGFNTYVLDTADNRFFSFVDTKRTVKQTRDIVNVGKVNDLNFSYAYSYKDKFYVGASLGIPQLQFESSTLHTEIDDKDSMRIGLTPPDSYTTTYIDEPPAIYENKLGFHSLIYEEYFKTSGSGLNLKIGGVARVSDVVRVGLYYHTPTVYRLTDEYYNYMSVAFDAKPSSPVTLKEPENDAYFKYRLITPSRMGVNLGFIVGTRGAIGLDYEIVNYKKARLSSQDISDFAGVNSVIQRKYQPGHNIRIGGELNLSPFMIRTGYNMQGSPFGHVVSGDFVTHTISAGLGYRSKSNFFIDMAFAKNISIENYYLFTTLNTKGKIEFNSTLVTFTAGLRF
jgi:long-subunit fatty acid transport protein